MRQRFFPTTAGDLHDPPERVRAPQRVLESIGTTLRLWALVIYIAYVLERAVGPAYPEASTQLTEPPAR